MDSEARVSIIKLNNLFFGIEIKYIREVLPAPAITRVPNVEAQFIGVFNLRGKIVPLVDICPILKMPAQRVKKEAFAIYCEVNGKFAGLLTEKVLEMRDLELEQLHVPGTEVKAELLPYVSSVYEDAQHGMIYVLDMISIFESAELNKYRFE